jgi:hypothetical protein
MKDKIGQEITAGCYIAYGHALGRCAGLRIGKILKVHADKVTIRGLDAEWSNRPPQLLSKNSTLFFPDRMIVLNPDTVPQAYKDLLGPITL